jgi:hypothetical protein
MTKHPAFAPIVTLVFVGLWFIQNTCFRVDGTLYSGLFDDAYISLTYARHLAEGHGLRWNVDEAPIEGFSNLGQVLLMALPHLARLPEHLIPLVVQLIGLVELLILVWLSTLLARALSPSARAAEIAAWLVALCSASTYWTLRGFEVGVGALCITGAAVLVASERLVPSRYAEEFVYLLAPSLRLVTYGQQQLDLQREQAHLAKCAQLDRDDARSDRRWLVAEVVLGFVAVLFRDDLVVPMAAVALFSRRRTVLLSCLGAAVLLKTGFRLAYFGDLVPLTAHLKLSAPLDVRLARGIVALEQGILHEGLWLPLLGCVAMARRSSLSRMPAAVLLSALAYEVYVGGDAWLELGFADRFVAPVLPVALVGLAVFLAELHLFRVTAARAWGAAAVLVALVVFTWRYAAWDLIQTWQPSTAMLGWSIVAIELTAWMAIDLPLGVPRPSWQWALLGVAVTSGASWARHVSMGSFEFFDDRHHVIHGLTLRAATREGAKIAVIQAGAESYYSHRYIIDELGKSDRHIALEPDRPGTWHPGHSHFDAPYSVGQLQPDVVDEVWLSDPWHPIGRMRSWGFRPANPNLWVRTSSKLVDANMVVDLARFDAAHWDQRKRWEVEHR